MFVTPERGAKDVGQETAAVSAAWPGGSMRFWIRLGVLAALATIAYYTIELGEVWRALAGGKPGFFALALGLAAADRLAMGFKWRQLIVAAGGRIPLGAVTSAYFQATFVGHVVPSAVTSEILRCYLVCRRGVDRSIALFSMAAERLIGAAATAALGLVALPVVGVRVSYSVSMAAVVAALIGGVLVWRLRVRFAARIAAFAARFLPSRPWEGGNVRWLLVSSFALAVGEQLLQVTIVVFVAAALGIAQWSVGFFAALVAITSVRRVVAYVESWGLAEGVSIALYVALGIDPSEAAALAIATYAVLVTAVLPGGLLLLITPSAERWPTTRTA